VDEFPSNSRSARPSPQQPAAEKKVITPVANATTRKKPLGKRLKETFFGGTTKGVWEYVLTDVLVPAARDMIADAASQGVERMVFGEARSASRRPGARPTVSTYSQTPYNRYSANPVGRASGQEQARPVNRIADPFDFGEILLATRAEADMVLDRMQDLLNNYGTVSVADLKDLVNMSGSYTDDKYGWLDLQNCGIRRVTEGYLLNLTRPEPLEK
jgi:hypothetical protein